MTPPDSHPSFSRIPRIIPSAALMLLSPGLGLTGCNGLQSTLNAAGTGAEQISQLFYWMSGGAAIIWLLMIDRWSTHCRLT